MSFSFSGKTAIVVAIVTVAVILYGFVNPDIYSWIFGAFYSLSR